jgi:endonuclease-3
VKSRGELIMERLIPYHEGKFVGLNYENVFQLTIAVMLSAQSTDVAVNKATPELFRRFPDAESLAKADVEEVKRYIKSIGLYNTKARNMVNLARILVEKYGGKVPDTMEELTSLPGIGRKSANIILSVGFDKTEGIAVDTHVFRIAHRTGLSNGKTPLQVEKDLLREIPRKYWKYANHILVTHGRNICTARNPKCDVCPINDLCEKRGL